MYILQLLIKYNKANHKVSFCALKGFGSTCQSVISGGYTKNRVCGYWLTTDNSANSDPVSTMPGLFSVCGE